jgi:hypothetical protein
MNLALNHIYLNPLKLLTYNKIHNRIKSKVIISYIFPNSSVTLLQNINTYDIVKKINNVNIHNVNNVISALKKPLTINGKKCVKIENDNNQFIIISYNKILKEDNNFKDLYHY